MSVDKFLEVSFSDEEVFNILKEAIVDIADYEDEITMDSYLIDDLGLDSLGFLDLFFTIQTTIQREVSNQEMRNLILEEFGYQNDPEILKLSDGEKDRLVYSKLQVKNFYNLIKKQLAKPAVFKMDFSSKIDKVFDQDKLQSYLKENFQDIKNEQLESHLKKYNIVDDRLSDLVSESINNITLHDIFDLLEDKSLLQDILKDTTLSQLYVEDEEKLSIRLDELTDELGENLDGVITKLFENEEFLAVVYDKVINEQIERIFDEEMKNLENSPVDNDTLQLIKNTFNNDLKDQKVKEIMDKANIGSELIEDLLTENFDEIAKEETERILQDSELRQKLVQEYIRENYDPSEVAGLSDPKKMREIQTAITQKYISENLDSIITRYMDKYMDEMLDAVEEGDLEMQGDLQDDFMKSFAGRSKISANMSTEQSEIVGFKEFVENYNISDPVVVSFIQANFEAVQSQVEIAQKVDLDHSILGEMIAKEFAPEPTFYFLGHLMNPTIITQIEKAFVTDQLENHMDEMMSSTIRTQLSFLGYDEEEEKQRVDAYIITCYEFIIARFKEIEVTKEMLHEQVKNFQWPGIIFFKLFDSEIFTSHRCKIMKIYFEVNEKDCEFKDLFTQRYFDQFDELFLRKLTKSQRLIYYELFFQKINLLSDLHDQLVDSHKIILDVLKEGKSLDVSLDTDSYFGRLRDMVLKKEQLFLSVQSQFNAKRGDASNVEFLEIVGHLSEDDVFELTKLFIKVSEVSKLGIDSLLNISYGLSTRIINSQKVAITKLKEDLFVESHNYILGHYDFFVADQLQEKLASPKIYDAMIDKVTHEILSFHSLSLFQKNLKNFFTSNKEKLIELSFEEQKELGFKVIIKELAEMSKDFEEEGW
ncbi:MAG: hypothetical protein COB02_02995 [Candidatus Cloacimonadota bacterium]|nr:MAG: hypothetical protein COB02_02995 [Candidatus Cloacimonadota bacterium]